MPYMLENPFGVNVNMMVVMFDKSLGFKAGSGRVCY